ncbi:ATP-binding protein [Cytobacillus sp. FJAT-53684]|uniref:ATP-binding protein n=1 Tax=Cytobacillus mangrovibacter TaxID=3299024 RepID=A0ABW6K411_9BACI
MSDFLDLSVKKKNAGITISNPSARVPATHKSNVPSYDTLQNQLAEASVLVDDIVLKNYLSKLTDLEVIPLDDSLKQIGNIRLFKITEMVYQNDEYSTYKLASVFNSVQNLNCGVFIVADSDGQKTDFYMGVRSLDDKRTTKSLKDTLRNALSGQFPGVKTLDLLDPQAEKILAKIEAKNIAAVSCVAKDKYENFKDNETYIQGLEKLALAMQGQRYTAVVLAKSTPTNQLLETRRAYEQIYTQLSPFANMQLSYGTNTALSISDAFSKGTTVGSSHSTNSSTQSGTSFSKGTTFNESMTTNDSKTNQSLGGVIKSGLGAVVGVAGIVATPFTGGLSLLAAGAAGAAINVIPTGTRTTGTSATTGKAETENFTSTKSETFGVSDSTNESTNENYTETKGLTTGVSDNLQLTMQNKTILNTLERIDLQLQRIDECESFGMWESAAYFLSDSQETVEMAAGTYKALMIGEKSEVEMSAINFWGNSNQKQKQLPMLRDYITNFIHPVFEYRSHSAVVPVTASSLVSGNELAIQMGLPRKSVCGFPVIEHADFGKEVVKYSRSKSTRNFALGKVFNMGKENDTDVRLDLDSLSMHTFITGSTGSGKSNTVYAMLEQLRNVYHIPFLVVEPAKGEYKDVFGQFSDVAVYGTNPKKSALLRINPFRFPADIHVLEHLDRLVEIFNVCWPMYAAMPAILKEAMEKAYIAVGWNISTSENSRGGVFPNFSDLLEQIENVINESNYSADNKGDYSGALLTRVRSLTTGLNGLIFCHDDLSDADLFDQSVIVDLSRVGSVETKSLIMGLLVMRLNEYRMAFSKTNSPLRHITVLEEAHNLLKRTSTEQVSEGSNLLGKSVELLANSIAEMRTYGEGFIIADQSPGLLDLSVIRNTNTKIILRLPEYNDRELVGLSANLNKEQIEELAKLERGVAAVYQNDWVEPVLVKINKCGIAEKEYKHDMQGDFTDKTQLRQQLLYFLIQGRVNERLRFDISEIERNIDSFQFSLRDREFVEEQVIEYHANNSLLLWSEGNFSKLARRVTNILGLRARIENIVATAADNTDLSKKLAETVRQFAPDASEQVIMTLSQCFMKDMAENKNETEVRRGIYRQWIDAEKEVR